MQKVFADYNARKQIHEASTHPFAKGVAWIEGKLVPLHEARIPLLDQGFMHSDLTYDVPSAWDGKFFRLDDHLARLEGACGKIRLRLPLSKEEIKKILTDMLVQSGIKDAFIELIVTRGLKGVRGTKPGDIKENLYMFIMPCEFLERDDVEPDTDCWRSRYLGPGARAAAHWRRCNHCQDCSPNATWSV